MTILRGKKKLVLSGSGTKYPVFIGALKRLLEEDIEIEEICGTSGGAIISAGFASWYFKNNPSYTINRLEQLALDTLPGPLLDPRWFTAMWGTNGIFKGKKIHKVLKKKLPKNFNKTMIPVNIVTFDVNYGRHRIWNTEDNIELPLAVRASLSLPYIFDPVKIKGHLHTDGGITANFPLDIFGSGNNVIGLRFGKEKPTYKKVENKLDFGMAHLNGMIESAMREHIEDALYARTCYLNVREKHWGLNLFMTKQDVLEQIEDGYASMDQFIQNINNRNK